jgi:hypothetical protein
MTILDRLRHLLSCSICVCVSATVFRRLCLHLCCSSSHLCCSICVRIGVAASVFHLCCSVCVSASVFLHLFSIHNRLPSMTTLTICVSFAVAIFPTACLRPFRFSTKCTTTGVWECSGIFTHKSFTSSRKVGSVSHPSKNLKGLVGLLEEVPNSNNIG